MQGSAKTFFSLRSRNHRRVSGQHSYRLCIMLGLALCVAACASQETRPELNSERIRQTFGSYGVDVLANDENRRVSSLYSSAGSDKTTRTYAVVDFIGAAKSALRTEHALIEAVKYFVMQDGRLINATSSLANSSFRRPTRKLAH